MKKDRRPLTNRCRPAIGEHLQTSISRKGISRLKGGMDYCLRICTPRELQTQKGKKMGRRSQMYEPVAKGSSVVAGRQSSYSGLYSSATHGRQLRCYFPK